MNGKRECERRLRQLARIKEKQERVELARKQFAEAFYAACGLEPPSDLQPASMTLGELQAAIRKLAPVFNGVT